MLFLDKSTFALLVLFGRIAHLTRTSGFAPKLAVDNAGNKRFFHGKIPPFGKAADEMFPDSIKITVGNRNSMTKISSTRADDDSASDVDQGTLLGTLVLLTVPLSWGTYVPVVRYLYKIDPPVPGFVFSACYYTLAAATTSILSRRSRSPSTTSSKLEEDTGIRIDELSVQSTIPVEGGIELGIYLFIANCLQVIGLQTVESDRAGFLVQLTTVMVPVCEGIFAGSLFRIPARTWGACIMAFLGLCIMGLDGKIDDVLNDSGEALFGVALSLSKGDLLILGSAVLYTLHVVRLGTYARRTNPMKLAASKATTECILSFVLMICLVGTSLLEDTYHFLDFSGKHNLISYSINSGREITSFFSSFMSGLRDGSISMPILLPAIGSIFWTGWITCAYTIWAQSFGQSKVSPSSANLIYTFQPIFTALFAYVLLGEKMGSVGILGGSIIATAVYIVASNESDDSERSSEML